MTISPFRAEYPNLKLIAQPDSFFGTVKEEYVNYKKNGFFQKAEDVALYVYEIVSPHHTHVGIVACVDVKDYFQGRIMKHEETIAAREKNMLSIVLKRKAMIKPVLLTYKRDKAIDKICLEARKQDPYYEVNFQGPENHLMYKVTDKKSIAKLTSRFKKHVSKAYIADGHHRCKTSAKLYSTFQHTSQADQFNKILCVLFPFEDLIIHDYNRVVEILHDISPTMLMAKLSKYCKIKEMKQSGKPKKKFEMTMYILREWYRLRWKKSVLDNYRARDIVLDGAILNDIVMNKILDIDDVREDSRLKYVEGLAGTEGVVNKADKNIFRMAFCLVPVKMREIVKVADQNDTLPPKSTWFEPRIKNGLIALEYDVD